MSESDQSLCIAFLVWPSCFTHALLKKTKEMSVSSDHYMKQTTKFSRDLFIDLKYLYF